MNTPEPPFSIIKISRDPLGTSYITMRYDYNEGYHDISREFAYWPEKNRWPEGLMEDLIETGLYKIIIREKEYYETTFKGCLDE